MVLILGGLHNPAQSYFNPHYHEITHPKGKLTIINTYYYYQNASCNIKLCIY